MVGLLLGSVVSSEDGLLLGSVVGSKDGTAVCADGAADGTGEGIEVVNVGLMQLFPSPGEPRLGQLPYAPLYKECQFSSSSVQTKIVHFHLFLSPSLTSSQTLQDTGHSSMISWPCTPV